MVSRVLDVNHEKQWFALFAERAMDGSLQLLFNEMIKEIDEELVAANPGNDALEYHRYATRLWAKREVLIEQLAFFDALKDEFQRRASILT